MTSLIFPMPSSYCADSAAETLSALMDGQLAGPVLDQALNAGDHDPEWQARWDAYHFIGDVLRSPELALQPSAPAFLACLQSRLSLEAPHAVKPAEQSTATPAVSDLSASPSRLALADGYPPSANDAWFGWKLMGAGAALAAVAVLAWNVAMPFEALGPQWAQLSKVNAESSSLAAANSVAPAVSTSMSPTPTSAALLPGDVAPQGLMVRDAQWDAFLAAHKQAGVNSALELPSGFLRNATFDTPFVDAPR